MTDGARGLVTRAGAVEARRAEYRRGAPSVDAAVDTA